MEYAITHNREQNRFETVVEGSRAYVEYAPSTDSIRITHTIVPVPIEGRGIAGALTKAVLEYARTANLKVIPICSYVVAYFKRHPEYEDLLK